MIKITNTGLYIIANRLIANTPLPDVFKIGNGASVIGHSASVSDVQLQSVIATMPAILELETTNVTFDTNVASATFDFAVNTTIDEAGVFTANDFMYVSMTFTPIELVAGETLTLIAKTTHIGV